MTIRKLFRCVIELSGQQLCTGITVTVPDGLTRQQAIDFVTGAISREVSRYAASEALNLGPFDHNTDWNEIVT